MAIEAGIHNSGQTVNSLPAVSENQHWRNNITDVETGFYVLFT